MSLAEHLRRRIAAGGPMPLSDYMAICLSHPEFGYYATRDPLGAAGDFITAPEVSQMFGELLGLALAQAWVDQGAPGRFVLAELGPGRGTMMADMLRATALVPGFVAAAEVVLVETSPALRAVQAGRVPGAAWAERLEDLPDLPFFLVANEFFDALPLHQFHRTEAGWHERMVGLDGDRLAWGLSPAMELGLPGPPGTVREVCPAGEAIAAGIGARLAARGGTAIVIDYGAWDGTGDTFQAVARHAPAEPLAEPGAADLTAHVRFAALAAAAAAAGARVAGFLPQGAFLKRLGIEARAAALARAGTARSAAAPARPVGPAAAPVGPAGSSRRAAGPGERADAEGPGDAGGADARGADARGPGERGPGERGAGERGSGEQTGDNRQGEGRPGESAGETGPGARRPGERADTHGPGGRAAAVASQLTRLTAPDQMGELFKVLVLTGPGAPVPPGCEAD